MLEVIGSHVDDRELCTPLRLHNAVDHVCKCKYAIAVSLVIAALAWIGYSLYSAHCSNVKQQRESMRAAYANLIKMT